MAYGTKEIKALLDKRFPGEKFKRIYKQGDIVDPNLTIRSFESKERIVCVISDFTGPTSVTAIELASPHRCTAILKELIAEAIEEDDQDKDKDELNACILDDRIRNREEIRVVGDDGVEELSFENAEFLSYENGKFVVQANGDWQEQHAVEIRISSDGYLYYLPGSIQKFDDNSKRITLSVKALTTRVIPTPTPLKKEYVFQVGSEQSGNQAAGYAAIAEKKFYDKNKCMYDQHNKNKDLAGLISNFNPDIKEEVESTWGIGDELLTLLGLTTAQEKLDYIEEFRQYLLAAGMTEVTF